MDGTAAPISLSLMSSRPKAFASALLAPPMRCCDSTIVVGLSVSLALIMAFVLLPVIQ